MTTLHILIALNVIFSCITIYILIRNWNLIKRLIEYQDGQADIQATIKNMILDHHTTMEQLVIDSTQEILRHVTYTNRWQKVMAKMIRFGHSTPLEKATGSETIKEAEELHEIGLDIAKTAFDDKKTIENGDVKKDEPPS